MEIVAINSFRSWVWGDLGGVEENRKKKKKSYLKMVNKWKS